MRLAHHLRREGCQCEDEAIRAARLLHHRDDEVLRTHVTSARYTALHRAREK